MSSRQGHLERPQIGRACTPECKELECSQAPRTTAFLRQHGGLSSSKYMLVCSCRMTTLSRLPFSCEWEGSAKSEYSAQPSAPQTSFWYILMTRMKSVCKLSTGESCGCRERRAINLLHCRKSRLCQRMHRHRLDLREWIMKSCHL